MLTNNHVIADSTSLQVENSADGSTHTAKVLGYDVADDVALVQIQNVSGLTPAPLGNSSNLSVGDGVVALGNAGGKGGSPSVVTGSVTALNQQITASDQDGSNAETLHHLIETDADIQPGDSGGPLTDNNGQVVGMDAAASSNNGGSGFAGQSTNQGYAIPIEDALAIAKKIASGDGGTNIHLGRQPRRARCRSATRLHQQRLRRLVEQRSRLGCGRQRGAIRISRRSRGHHPRRRDHLGRRHQRRLRIRSHPRHERSLTRRHRQRHLDRLVRHQPARLHPTRVRSPRLSSSNADGASPIPECRCPGLLARDIVRDTSRLAVGSSVERTLNAALKRLTTSKESVATLADWCGFAIGTTSPKLVVVDVSAFGWRPRSTLSSSLPSGCRGAGSSG